MQFTECVDTECDFHYHINAEANVYIKEFLGLLECFGLKKYVQIETHIKGNTLDLVITRENELLPMDITTDTSVTSDDAAVLFGIPVPKPLSGNEKKNEMSQMEIIGSGCI